MNGTLYVVATPIGNLDDMTARAIEVLSSVELIAAEDTRHSAVLLERFHIRTRMISCHKFNEASRIDMLIGELQNGRNIALISDAGTPCISDPGYLLIRRAAETGITVTGVCGASAAVTAVSVSGFPAVPYMFIGFWPREAKAVEEALSVLRLPGRPLAVFYESPKRVLETMKILESAYPDAQICLCNDLTKKFERIYRGTPASVIHALRENPYAEKGEYTCVVENRGESRTDTPEESCEALSIEARLVDAMVRTGCSLKEAVQILAEERQKGLRKKEIYAASLRVKELLEQNRSRSGVEDEPYE